MLEQEAWGQLTKEQFDGFLKLFSERFGEASMHRRLSFSFWDRNRKDLDIRVKITDGKAELVEKVGWVENSSEWNRTEREARLLYDACAIFNMVKIFQNLFPDDDPLPVMQYENYVWQTGEFEVKLSHQFGTGDKYNFEVETLYGESDLQEILRDLDLTNLVKATDVNFWEKWNEAVNLDGNKLNDEEIRNLIKEYL